MKTLRSHVCGAWHTADDGFKPLVDPSTEQQVARVSSRGVDFAAVLDHARRHGGPALRAMSFAERAGLLKAMSRLLRENRDELLELSRVNTGTTAADGAFDLDGASGTLAWYAGWGRRLGEHPVIADGDGIQLARSEGFWGQHVLAPRQGVAVHVNAFNFPAWGFAEKAACSLLAGMPFVSKPATATALVTERCVELIVEADVLPAGAMQFVCGSTGDLLDLLGPTDVLAFTGSADTAAHLRDRDNLRRANTRVNVEADSLNAAVLAPGAGEGDVWDLFLRDVAREMTQKTGQKCTAVRRVLVPGDDLDRVREALAARLAEVVTGDPSHDGVTMGPLATAQQLDDAVDGVAELAAAGRIVAGTGLRADGEGAEPGCGFFFPPTLLAVDDARAAEPIHRREVFGPVATLMPYDGSAEDAAAIVALAEGTLVTSVYGDDEAWLTRFVADVGGFTGRVYVGSEGSAGDAPGSGIAMPQSLHGGPGRAGGGEELGGIYGLSLYMQRVALQGEHGLVDKLAGLVGE